jgi:hypothetical protein
MLINFSLDSIAACGRGPYGSGAASSVRPRPRRAAAARVFSHLIASRIGGRWLLYVIGGRRAGSEAAGLEFLCDAWVFDTVTDHWAPRTAPPGELTAGEAVAVDDRHVLFLGYANADALREAERRRIPMRDFLHPGFPRDVLAYDTQRPMAHARNDAGQSRDHDGVALGGRHRDSERRNSTQGAVAEGVAGDVEGETVNVTTEFLMPGARANELLRPIRKRRYAFSESFAAIGYAAWARATGRDEYAAKAARCFQLFLNHVPAPKFTAERQSKAMSGPMIAITTAQTLRASIGYDAADAIIDRAIEEIERDFVKQDLQAVMEQVALDGSIVDHVDGRTLHPGHAIEGAWFIMEEAKHRGNDARLVRLGCRMLDYMWERGWDREHGGIRHFVDLHGKPVQEYWHDMKFWWPYNETIIATLMSAMPAVTPKCTTGPIARPPIANTANGTATHIAGEPVEEPLPPPADAVAMLAPHRRDDDAAFAIGTCCPTGRITRCSASARSPAEGSPVRRFAHSPLCPNAARTISRSLRQYTEPFARAGWHQSKGRRMALLVGSSRRLRPSSSYPAGLNRARIVSPRSLNSRVLSGVGAGTRNAVALSTWPSSPVVAAYVSQATSPVARSRQRSSPPRETP